MKNLYSFLIIMLCSTYFACKQSSKEIDYGVVSKDSGNFSVQFPELQYQERILITINDDIILSDSATKLSGNPIFWKYYNYPKKIIKIEFSDFFKGKLKERKTFKDTLIDIKQRTLIVSRPIPKGITKANWKPYGLVSIDTGFRKVNLVNDSIAFSGMWTDKAIEIKVPPLP
ncbi:hypothetical protein [Mucilaginibacter glaciei]|uniref:Uncharacterized protein n=1 Tax=Mucilaginibacter glaciei TaxID=2772109 RepID=A0A926S1W7_9SPHI|nr:hypothetical protein [Mucilaginibacter glaciei]MBD1392589.1 hypothetical protein [Mucilaginibacter glaciei]